jgi:hypothetical protein
MFIGILINIGPLIESFMRGVIIHLFVFFSAIYMIKWGECCQIYFGI